jgi:hypothetical protein
MDEVLVVFKNIPENALSFVIGWSKLAFFVG